MSSLTAFDYLLQLKTPSCLSVDDEGKYVCFQIKCNTDKSISFETMLWERSSGELRSLGAGRQASLSPNGERVAWIEPSGKSIAIHSLSGTPLIRFPVPSRAAELRWSPDSMSLLLTAEISCAPRPYPPLEIAYIVDRLKFKVDNAGRQGLWDGTYRQVLLLEINASAGHFKVLTHDEKDHRLPFWLDPNNVGYVTNCGKDPDLPDQFDRDSLFIQSLKNNKTREIARPGGPIRALSVSPDKTQIAFTGHDYSFFEATNEALYTVSISSEGLYRYPSGDFSCTNHVFSDLGLMEQAPSPHWLPGGKIACVVTYGGNSEIWIFTPNQMPCPLSQEVRAVYDLCSDRHGNLASIISTSHMPAALVFYKNETAKETQIWESPVLENAPSTSAPQPFKVFSEGKTLEAWYLPPVSKKSVRGIVLAVHGGPHICYGHSFSLDFQIFSATGYGVVYGNPTGSQGYGQSLSAASKHDWGGQDYRDVMAIMDEAIKHFSLQELPWAIIGGSYGGFMVNWVIGRTNRFSCAVSERGTSNRYSQAGTSDCAYRYGIYEFDGTPWENTNFYMEHSPISWASEIQTPLLLIHGEEDMNCPITQSEEMFMALKALGREVLLARFPGAAHSFASRGTLKARRDRYNLILWWLGKYLTNQA